MGIDVGAGQKGKNAATIRSLRKEVRGFGILVQSFHQTIIRGKG